MSVSARTRSPIFALAVGISLILYDLWGDEYDKGCRVGEKVSARLWLAQNVVTGVAMRGSADLLNDPHSSETTSVCCYPFCSQIV